MQGQIGWKDHEVLYSVQFQKINALHFKMESETFNITQGFYTFRAFLLVSKSFYLIVCYSEIWIKRVFEV